MMVGAVTMIKKKKVLRYRNLPISLELSESDHIVSPTEWQRDQLPKHFAERTNVIHEGVDTDFFVMNTSWRHKSVKTNYIHNPWNGAHASLSAVY